MKRRLLLLTLGALFALLLAGIAVVIYVADLGRFRPQIEAALSEALQLNVAIDGKLGIGWSLVPEIVVEGVSVRLPDTPGTEPALASVGRIELEIAIVPFLRERRLEIPRVAIADATVVVDEGLRRRLSTPAEESAPPPEAPAPRRADGDEPPLPRVDRLDLRNAVLRLQSPDGSEKRLTLETLAARRRARLALDVDLLAEYEALRYELELTTETPAPGSRRWPIALELDISGLRLTLNGAFADVTRLGAGLAFDAKLEGGSTGWLNRVLDLPPSDIRYDLSARVDADTASLAVTELNGLLSDLGPLDRLQIAEGNVHWQFDAGGRMALQGEVDAQPFSLSATLPARGAVQAEDALVVALDAGGTTARVAGRFRLDDELSFTGRLETSTPVLGNLPGLSDLGLPPLGPIRSTTRFSATARQLILDDWALSLGSSEFTGSWQIPLAADRPRADVMLRASRVEIPDFLPSAAAPPDLDATLDLTALAALDATVDFRIDSVTSLPLPLTDVTGRLSLSERSLHVSGLEATAAAIPVNVSINLTAGRQLEFDASLAVPSLEIPDALHALETIADIRLAGADALTGEVDGLQASVTSRGASMRELVEGLGASFTLSGGRLAARGAEAPVLLLRTVRIHGDPQQPLALDATATLNGTPMTLTATAGKLSELIETPAIQPLDAVLVTRIQDRELRVHAEAGKRDAAGTLPMAVAADYAGLHLRAQSSVPSLAALPGARWAVSADSENITTLLRGEVNTAEPLPVQARATLSVLGGSLRFDDLVTMLGDMEVAGTLSATLRDYLMKLEGSLRSEVIDLRALRAGAASRAAPPDQASADTASPAPADGPAGRLFPDTPLPLEPVPGLELDLTLQAGSLWLGNILLREANNHLTLSPSTLTYALDDEHGRARLALFLETLDTGDADYRLRVEAALREVRRDRLWESAPADLQFDLQEYPALNMDMRLEGQGHSVAALAASAEGSLTLWMDRGKLPPELRFGLLFDDILGQTLTALNPLKQQRQYYQLECAALHLDVEDGIATATRGFAIQTESTNFVGGGAINFAEELIDLRIDSTPRRGLGLSILGFADDFVRITGTLTAPRAVLDTRGALTKGVAGWATGGLSLLYGGPIKRLFARRDPCSAVLEAPAD